MSDEKKSPSKGGFTVGELEGKVRKFGVEIVLCASFVLTAIFALIWGGAMMVWSILLCMIFSIIGALVPKSIHKLAHHTARFALKDKVTGIVIAVVLILLSIFLPPIVFAIVGAKAGKSFLLDIEPHRGPEGHHHS
jgi:hypothetical protein